MKINKNVEEIKRYLPEILNQATNGIVITDPNQFDNPIVYVNQSFCNIFGYEANEVIGRW